MGKYVLWLASWYPSKVDPYNGDFIERHAKAVSSFVPLKLIYIVKDPSLKAGAVRIERDESPQLSVYQAYYNTKPGSFEVPLSLRMFFSLNIKIFQEIKSLFGLPALTHVHVAFKAGLFARYLLKKYHIPYVISEHWSGYFKENLLNIYRTPMKKWLTEKILNDAKFILPVSESLGAAISRISSSTQIVIPNVVDTSRFYEGVKLSSVPVFVHVSNMAGVKNAQGIIRAAVNLRGEGMEFKLMMIGAAPGDLLELARDHDALDEYVFFIEAIPYRKVAEFLRGATALVLFSRFETQSCVALEALCCGVPVIASRVGGIPEIIGGHNGILVKSENEGELQMAMREMIQEQWRFNRKQISKDAIKKYSYEKVGREILKVYEKVGL